MKIVRSELESMFYIGPDALYVHVPSKIEQDFKQTIECLSISLLELLKATTLPF